MSTRNKLSGPAAGNVVQAGTINGDVNIKYGHSNDLGVYLKHERKEVHFKVDAIEWFHLTITNRSRRERLVDLRLESTNTTGLLWGIADRTAVDAIPLPADGSIRLRLKVECTPTAIAGPDVLKVLAGEANEHTGERIWYPSDPLPIHVEHAPDLDADLKQPGQRVYAAGTYETVVTLANKGNTDLSGRLWIPTEFDGAEPSGWLTSEQVTFVDDPSFHFGPGGRPIDVRIEIKLPPSDWFERTWQA